MNDTATTPSKPATLQELPATYSALTKIEKRLLPAAAAHGGMHAHLRSLAKGLI